MITTLAGSGNTPSRKRSHSVGPMVKARFDRRASSRPHVHILDDSDLEEMRRKTRTQSFASIKFYSDLDSTIHQNVPCFQHLHLIIHLL